jgi:hypothetical protein
MRRSLICAARFFRAEEIFGVGDKTASSEVDERTILARNERDNSEQRSDSRKKEFNAEDAESAEFAEEETNAARETGIPGEPT